MSSLQEKAKVLLRAVGEPEVDWRHSLYDWVTDRIGPESVSVDIETLKRIEVVSVLDKYVRPGQRVLDVGFGKGKFVHYFISKGCVVTRIENERILVEQLKAIKPEYDLEFGDALDLAYDDASFDIYHTQGLIFYFDWPLGQLRMLAEAHRVLRDGGLLIIIAVVPGALWRMYKVYSRDAYHSRFWDWLRRLLGKKPLEKYSRGYYLSRSQFRLLVSVSGFEILEERPLDYASGVLMWGGDSYFRKDCIPGESAGNLNWLGKLLYQINKIDPWFSPQICAIVARKQDEKMGL